MGMKSFSVHADWNKMKKDILTRIENVRKAAISRFEILGEMVVADAKSKAGYKDRTGNLRSSIGYGLYAGSKLIKTGGFVDESPRGSDIQEVHFVTKEGKEVHFIAKVKKGGKTGIQKGEDFLKQYTPSAGPDKLTLVIVAGMEYAEYVETKGFNVLTASEQFLSTQAKEIAETIIKQTFKR